MATSAIRSKGTTITIDGVGITEAYNFSGPTGSTTFIDATHFGSDATEKIADVADYGQFTLSANLIPGDPGQATLIAKRQSGDPGAFVVTYADGTTVTFSALVTGFVPSGAVRERLTVSVTLEITGAAVWA